MGGKDEGSNPLGTLLGALAGCENVKAAGVEMVPNWEKGNREYLSGCHSLGSGVTMNTDVRSGLLTFATTYGRGMRILEYLSRHPGYRRMFKENHLTLGLFFPIEAYTGSIPLMNMEKQVKLAKRAEQLNFASLVVRDVPLHDPNIGDVGQIYDPWVFLGYIAANTEKIALVTGSIILTLRHPLHVAKAAASVDKISGGRLVLGVATGDRPIEFPSFSVDFEQRGELFREALSVIKTVWKENFPVINTLKVHMSDGDLIPKPDLNDIPVLVTGHSGQSIEWIAKNADGWMYYPRNLTFQTELIRHWRSHTDCFKPFSQSLYIDLTEDPDEDPTPIHLGFRTGRKFLIQFLESLRNAGVNHVMINLKYGQRPASEVIEELGEEVLPLFPAKPMATNEKGKFEKTLNG